MCDDFFDDFGWEDMALAGSLSEEMAEEEKERRRIEREMEKEQEESDCCCKEKDYDMYNPPDGDPYP